MSTNNRYLPGQRRTRPLSRRHLQVLMLLADGHTGPEIARQLFLAESTVKAHINEALARLDARNRVHAVAIALRTGAFT